MIVINLTNTSSKIFSRLYNLKINLKSMTVLNDTLTGAKDKTYLSLLLAVTRCNSLLRNTQKISNRSEK